MIADVNKDENTITEPKLTPKKILVAIVTKFAETGVDLTSLLGVDLAETLANFYDSIKTTAVRGLPAVERLAMVEQLIRSHYEAMPSLDSPKHGDWSYETLKLLQRKQRIEREIAEGGAHPEPKKTRAAKK